MAPKTDKTKEPVKKAPQAWLVSVQGCRSLHDSEKAANAAVEDAKARGCRQISKERVAG